MSEVPRTSPCADQHCSRQRDRDRWGRCFPERSARPLAPAILWSTSKSRNENSRRQPVHNASCLPKNSRLWVR